MKNHAVVQTRDRGLKDLKLKRFNMHWRRKESANGQTTTLRLRASAVGILELACRRIAILFR